MPDNRYSGADLFYMDTVKESTPERTRAAYSSATPCPAACDLWVFIMTAVKKFSATSMLHSRLLSENADGLRRSVKETVRMARGEVHKSKNIIAQSQAAVEQARKILDDTKRDRLARKGNRKRSG